VREGQARGPLAPSYCGPYCVLEKREKTVRLQVGDCEDWVALEQIKANVGAAHVNPAVPPARGRPRNFKEAATENSAS